MTRLPLRTVTTGYGVRVTVHVETTDATTEQEMARVLDLAAAQVRARYRQAAR